MRRSPPAQYAISTVAAQPSVHAAFRWLHLEERRIMEWQREIVSIPAPPFGELRRARRLQELFLELGFDPVEIDPEGNVVTPLPGANSTALPYILLSAHIDTAFPADTPISAAIDGCRLEAPGACDNGAGLAAMLAIAAALRKSGAGAGANLLFAGNVGEEGEGDLRGMRYLYGQSRWKDRIAAHIVLDGAGTGAVVTQALGSRRFRATISAPGGHSWADAGVPNPILLMSRAIVSLQSAIDGGEPQPGEPRTTWNVGTIAGGSTVNSIPERAEARFDFRSLSAEQLLRLEVALHRTIEDVVLHANAAHESAANPRSNTTKRSGRPGFRSEKPGPVHYEIRNIGDRPPGRLAQDKPLIQTLRAVDRHLGIPSEERTASTDANIPLSLGIPAISIGAGGTGGGIHTRSEWYDAGGRELALRRILLLLLGLSQSVLNGPESGSEETEAL